MTYIGTDAFKDCSGLTSVTIPSSVTYIGPCAFGAFAFSYSLTSVTSLAATPPQARGDSFSNYDIPLYVPAGTRDAYLAQEPWNKFKEIIEIDNTDEDEKEAYAVLNDNNTVLTFYYDNQKAARNGMDLGPFYGYNNNDLPSWYGQRESITSVVFDASFANCTTLTSTAYWFCSLQNLSSITGISNLKTDNVTNMGWLFSGCSSLKTIYAGDGWSTAKVQNGESMFKDCTSLVGGAGTTFNAIHTDHTYAHIDGGSSNPGYFTSKGATLVEEDVDEITIKDTGKTTWCSKYDLDFTNVEGVKAYTATGYDDVDKTIGLTRVMKVPAGTGILVKGNAGTYKIPHASVRSAYANWFVGNFGEPISIGETDGDKTNYYLKDGTFKSVKGSANIGKNKAYLQLPTSIFAGTRSIGISYNDEDGTTGIKSLTPAFSEGEGEWYTLQGQRVANPGKGLYIRNGIKVVIK